MPWRSGRTYMACNSFISSFFFTEHTPRTRFHSLATKNPSFGGSERSFDLLRSNRDSRLAKCSMTSRTVTPTSRFGYVASHVRKKTSSMAHANLGVPSEIFTAMLEEIISGTTVFSTSFCSKVPNSSGFRSSDSSIRRSFDRTG